MSKFATGKWVEAIDVLNGQYSINKNIRLKNTMPRSNLCNYSDAYVVVKGRITAADTNNANRRNKIWSLRIMLHLNHPYWKLVTRL